MLKKWYVKHKNPDLAETNYGKVWSVDGPFSEAEAHLHVIRCEFKTRSIPHEVYSRRVQADDEEE